MIDRLCSRPEYKKLILVFNERGKVGLEKLIVTQLIKKFVAFCGTRRFITVFTRAHHWSLS